MVCEVNENTIPVSANVVYYGNFLGYGDIHTYKYSMSENETVTFNINIQQELTSPNATLKLYRSENDGSISFLGISYLLNFTNVFDYDGIIGDYFFCLESVYSAPYDIMLEFTDYTGILLPPADAYTGEIGFCEFEEPVAVCKELIGYQMIDGNLPTGLEFGSNGIISGTAIEQDCDSRSDETASWNWKNQENGLISPLAKEYFINIQAYFIDHPYIKTNKWFKVCVHNNWDLDDQTENVLNLSRKEYDISYIDVEKDPSGLCPCTEVQEIITERIINFKRYVSDDWNEDNNQLDKLMYDKQCSIRHTIEPKDNVYLEPVKEETKLPDTLCPVCPNDK